MAPADFIAMRPSPRSTSICARGPGPDGRSYTHLFPPLTCVTTAACRMARISVTVTKEHGSSLLLALATAAAMSVVGAEVAVAVVVLDVVVSDDFAHAHNAASSAAANTRNTGV